MPAGRKLSGGPDHGWSWVVAVACTWIFFLTFGFFRSAGVFYLALVNVFGIRRQQAAWPFSLCTSVACVAGLLAGSLSHRLSARCMVFFGGLMTSIGLFLCYFATSIFHITVFIGVVYAVGFGMLLMAIPIVVSQYFVKYRATANGLAQAGAPVGSFVFPLISDYFMEEYSLSGTFLLLSGIVLNTLVGAALLRPPPWLRKGTGNSSASQAVNIRNTTSALPAIVGNVTTTDEVICTDKANSSRPDLCKCMQTSNYRNDPGDSCDSESMRSSWIVEAELLAPVPHEVEDLLDHQHEDEVLAVPDGVLEITPVKAIKDVEDVNMNEALDLKTADEQLDPFLGVPKRKQPPWSTRVARYASYVCRLVAHPMFLVTTVTASVYFLSMLIYFLSIVDFAVSLGIPEKDAGYAYLWFSLSDLVGRLLLGWVADRGVVRRSLFVAINMMLFGVIFWLLTIAWDYTSIMALSVVMGLMAGGIIIIFPVLLADYLALERMPLAMGIMYFFCGLVNLSIPTMIGYFRDTTGKYDRLFHTAGGLSTGAGLLWLLEPCLMRTYCARS